VEGDSIRRDLEDWGWCVGYRVHGLYNENSKENTTTRNTKEKKTLISE